MLKSHKYKYNHLIWIRGYREFRGKPKFRFVQYLKARDMSAIKPVWLKQLVAKLKGKKKVV